MCVCVCVYFIYYVRNGISLGKVRMHVCMYACVYSCVWLNLTEFSSWGLSSCNTRRVLGLAMATFYWPIRTVFPRTDLSFIVDRQLFLLTLALFAISAGRQQQDIYASWNLKGTIADLLHLTKHIWCTCAFVPQPRSADIKINWRRKYVNTEFNLECLL